MQLRRRRLTHFFLSVDIFLSLSPVAHQLKAHVKHIVYSGAVLPSAQHTCGAGCARPHQQRVKVLVGDGRRGLGEGARDWVDGQRKAAQILGSNGHKQMERGMQQESQLGLLVLV